jgi:hypothetical protein
MLTDLHLDKSKYLILPLIFLTFVSSYAYAIDYDLDCPENKVVIVRTTNPNPICVYHATAQHWIGMGIAEYVETLPKETVDAIPEETVNAIPEEPVDDSSVDGGDNLAELLGFFSSMISEVHYDNVPDELSRAQSYLVTFSNGEFTEPLTIQTFNKVQPGDGAHLVSALSELGLDTYFSLSSTPSKDKIEFYNLVAQTINAGKDPELFDVDIDILAGDNSAIITVNYTDCEITDYLPYTQDFLLFYQFSDMIGREMGVKSETVQLSIVTE